MKERIDIGIDEARLAKNEENAERFRKARNFETTDRVPVDLNTNQWTALAARGRLFKNYIHSPEDNLREQLLNLKWRLETIRDDRLIPTECVGVSPDLGCIRGVEFDMEIKWPDDQPPKSIHPLQELEQIDSLAMPEPDGGLNRMRIEWYHAMRDCRKNFDLRLNGKALEIHINLGHPGGPIPAAFALAGSNLFLWMAMDPDRVHRLMDLATESHIRCKEFFHELTGTEPGQGIGMGCDTAEMLSPGMFREFVVPYYNRIYERYGGHRGFHNCGKNEHLLELIRDDLKIDSHNGFGSCVEIDVLAEKMAGRVVLQGGPSPVLLRDGTKEEIQADTRRYIEKLGARAGSSSALEAALLLTRRYGISTR